MSDLVVVTLPSEEKAEEAARSCLRCNENTFAVSGNTIRDRRKRIWKHQGAEHH